MIYLTAYPVAGGRQTAWEVSQDARHLCTVIDDEPSARYVAAFCAHRASLLSVLAARQCTHDPVTVHPRIGERAGRLAQICRSCFAFRRRIGCAWGQWEASAPDVEAVHFPDPDGPAVTVPWPDGAGFLVHGSEGL